MTEKFKALSRLLNGEKPQDIADSSNSSYAKVLRWGRELKEAQANNTIAELMQVDQAVLDGVLEELKYNLPEAVVEEGEAAIEAIKAAPSLFNALQQDLMQTASNVNMRARSLALSADNVGELSMIADILCAMQNAFFNKNQTQVNVQNNYDSSDRAYNNFLSDKPAAEKPPHL